MTTSSENRYWRGWATTGFAIVVMLAWFVSQIVGSIAYVVGLKIHDPSINIIAVLEGAETDGNLISFAVVVSSIAGGVVCAFLAWLKPESDVWLYLGVKQVSLRTIAACLGLTFGFIVLADATTIAIGRDVVPEFMAIVYDSASFKPLLWISLCLFAPVFEELLFRGFLIPGWSQTRLGVVGAIILSSAAWALIHVQYGPYELTQIAVAGVILGAMRVKTGSILPPIACHVFANIVATTEAAINIDQWL
ncbi:MAG: CPBP family intramembrane metalloprotease [Planctomycetaceae bacterium]|nr:CPBP family intramembrane metalloprotease [Planctomycetaceae bacterium]